MPTAADLIPRSHHPGRATLALALALLVIPVKARADDKTAPAKTEGNSIGDNIRSLGQQISDPKTPDRIKGHEQEFEKNVKDTREQQRKSHPGEVRARDATDMATSPKMGGKGTTTSATKSTTSKSKAGAKVKKTDGAPSDTKAASAAKTPPPAPTPPTK